MPHNSLFQTSKNASATVEELKTSPAGQSKKSKTWRPVTLRAPYLVSLILVTAGLIFAIQWLLATSQREQGIIFAADINDLPLRRSFCYLYLPTIVSVIYSFLWTWVDLDVKRLEPYFQLSRPEGATGAESILLNYPLEFLVTIPLNAFKRRHWSVLMASVITMMVFWGLTPTQAGIFATRTVTIHESIRGEHATAYTPLSKQGNLTATYAQSVYNIAWLNESLPPFMTKSFVLNAFGPSQQMESGIGNANYSGMTNLYSVDVACEPAVLWQDPSAGIVRYNGTQGSQVCSFYAPPFRINGGNDTSKPFDTMYVGYQNKDGFADYYLSSSRCDESFFHYFFIRWSKSTQAFIKSNNYTTFSPDQANATALFCKPNYYQQLVNATVSLPTRAVLDVQILGDKQALPNDLFNISSFEWAMSSGQTQSQTRGDFPTDGFPDQKSRLESMPLNLAYIPKMAPFAIATDQQALDDYLDPEQLRRSYQSAYRLLFARELSDILDRSLNSSTKDQGERVYERQAVVVVPGFAYAATILLVFIAILGTGLLVIAIFRPNNLRCDPATIASLMNLAASDEALVQHIGHLDGSSTEELSKSLGKLSFQLQPTSDSNSVLRVKDSHITCAIEDDISSTSPHEGLGVRPTEMKVLIGRLFLLLQIAAFITFLALFVKAKREKGLALPSQSTFVRQLVENYIPILIATFLEPFWLVLNRLSGLLLPFEQMRKGNAPGPKSAGLDYSSLPPQLLFVRAFWAGHYILVLLCFMVLLANVLSVALSGLMYEGEAIIDHVASATPLKSAHFKALNATGLPFNTNQAANSQGDSTSEPFYRMMSNLTADTPLPAWSDKHFAYVPMNVSGSESNTTVQVKTQAFSAPTKCRTLHTDGKERYSIKYSADASEADLTLTLETDDGSTTNCTNLKSWMRTFSGTESALHGIRQPHPGRSAVETNSVLASMQNGSRHDVFCREHFFTAWIRADWKKVNDTENLHGYYDLELLESSTTALVCRPSIEVADVEVLVDRAGQVQYVSSIKNSTSPLADYFTTTPADLIAQANQFLIDSDATWHNDSAPSDFNNYLIQKSHNVSFFNASEPPPSPEIASKYFAELYEQLFAILVSTNTNLLLEDTPSNTSPIDATLLRTETRILFSTPAFIVTETILLAYIITTILFYARRPWRVLPRLPSTVASNIAFFAASRALYEIGTGSREVLEDRRTWRWGYGTFVGRDGKMHTGIEREPFVKVLNRDGMLRRKYAQKKESSER